MRRITLLSLVLALCAGTSPSALEAQFRFRGVEFWGGQYSWSGDDVSSLDPGFRGGFGIYAELTPGLGIAIEGVTGGFDSDATGPVDRIRWDDAEANLVLRQALGDRAGIHPFIGGRFGWTRISTVAPSDMEAQILVLDEDGLSYGGELGVEIPLNRRARVIIAGGVTYREYGGAELEGVGIPGPEFSGTRWGLRVGMALGRSVG
jgi:hypothetical protein